MKVLSKKQEVLLKIILCISIPFFTILLSNRYQKSHILIGSIIAFMIGIIIMKKIKIEKINTKSFIASLFFSSLTIKEWLVASADVQNNISLLIRIQEMLFHRTFSFTTTMNLLGIMAFPFAVLLITIWIDKMVIPGYQFLKELSKTEKSYLLIMTIIGVILSIGITRYTTAFSKPFANNQLHIYDVIYTSDSGALSYENTFIDASYEENDIRQPIFGIMSLPFSIPALFISKFLFFVQDNFTFEVSITIFQFILTTITTILIARMLSLEDKDKKYLYLLFSCSFPYMIFNLIIEQYVIALFYVIVTIYIHYNNPNRLNYSYIGAVGTLITSGILFPMITKFHSAKQWIKDVGKVFLAFCSTLIIGGQFPQVLLAFRRMKFLLNSFAKKVTFPEKIIQYTNFVKGIFFANTGNVKVINKHFSYQTIDFQKASIIGIIILGIIFISYLMNHRNKMARLSFLWVLFSIIILVIVGWGTAENGLILYSLYFGWAFLILYFLFCYKIGKGTKIYKLSIIVTCIGMLIVNSQEMIKILKFALEYFKVIL